MKKCFFLIGFLISLISIFAQEIQPVTLQWDSLQGDYQYVIYFFHQEIRIKEIKTRNSSISIQLPPGDYQYSIGYINKFGKLFFFKENQSLRVESRVTPFLIGNPEIHYFQEQDPPQWILEIANFMTGGTISLIGEEDSLQLPYKQLDPSHYQILWPQIPLLSPVYNLLISNPTGEELNYPEVLKVEPALRPRLGREKYSVIHKGSGYIKLEIEGSFFTDQLSWEIIHHNRGNSLPLVQKCLSSEKQVLWLQSSDAELGKYDILIKTPWGEEINYRNSLIIQTDPLQRNDIDRKTWGCDILAGYTGISLKDPIGPMAAAELQFRMDFAQEAPLIRNLGLLAAVNYEFPAPDHFTGLGLGIYYSSRFEYPVNFFLSGIWGIKWNLSQGNGPYLEAQSGISLQMGNILAEPVINYHIWLGPSDNLSALAVGLRFGYRL